MTKMNKKSKHDATIDTLVGRLDPRDYSQIAKNIEYFKPNCKSCSGEVDAMAFKIDPSRAYLLLFEIKSNDSVRNYNKAVKQLDRSEDHYHKFVDKIYKFYVTPNEDKTLNITRVNAKIK